MLGYSIEDIIRITGGTLVPADYSGECKLNELVMDSRAVKKDDIFVALTGGATDGHKYIPAAFELGAGCCLAEHIEAPQAGPVILVKDTLLAMQQIAAEFRSSLDIPVIGITGSVGKTTAKEMIASVLSRKYRVLKNEGNYNNHMGVPITLSRIIPGYHEIAVVEMGISGFGEMTVLAKMARPDAALFTVIGHAHLEFLHDLDGVLKAKTEMLDYLQDGAPVIINGDDPYLRKIVSSHRIITFGFDKNNDIYADNINDSGTENVECDIHVGNECFHAVIPGFGRHLVNAALEGTACGYAMGLKPEEIIEGISGYATVGRRFSVLTKGDFTFIDDCYNANPDSVKSSLETFSALKGRKIFIFGEMRELGENSGEMHKDIGSFAAEKGIDILLCSGENVRCAADAFGGKGIWYPDREELIEALPGILKDDDNVLIKASLGSKYAEISEFIKKYMKL